MGFEQLITYEALFLAGGVVGWLLCKYLPVLTADVKAIEAKIVPTPTVTPPPAPTA